MTGILAMSAMRPPSAPIQEVIGAFCPRPGDVPPDVEKGEVGIV